MLLRILTIEREYGSGGAVIAEVRDDERPDPLFYRLMKVFARGRCERSLPVADADIFNTAPMVSLLNQVIEPAAASRQCVIVGRGAPYILRSCRDVFHVFIYVLRDPCLSGNDSCRGICGPATGNSELL